MGEVRAGTAAAADFAALAADLRKASARTLRGELAKGLAQAQKPIVMAIKANAARTLPSGGGRGRRRTRLVDTGSTLTNAVSGRTHKIKRKVKVGGKLAAAESVADRVAGARFRTSVSGGKSPRARISAAESRGRRIDLYSLNDGDLRHPLFGMRRHWFAQRVKAGWFTDPIEANRDTFAKGLETAVTNVTNQINRS